MAIRGRPARDRLRIEERAMSMIMEGERINKSRIARELRVNIRTVFRVLPRISA
jgi:hypothetical protein